MAQIKLQRSYRKKRIVVIETTTTVNLPLHDGIKCFRELPGDAFTRSYEKAHELFACYTAEVIAENIIYAR